MGVGGGLNLGLLSKGHFGPNALLAANYTFVAGHLMRVVVVLYS